MKTKLLLVLAFFVFQFSFSKSVVVADPVAPSVQPLVYCDSNNDGFGEFDLSSATSFILAAQSGNASDYLVTYHETSNDSTIGANPVSSPYFNITPWSQVIYYRITNINTNAYATGQVALVDNPTPEATTPTDYSLCDLNGSGTEVFDLTTKIAEILGSLNPATNTVTFHTSLADAQTQVSIIIQLNAYMGVDGETIYARVTNNATGCYDVVSFQLRVEPIPQSIQPNYPQYALCDVTGLPGYETFDLTSRITSILLGQTGVTVSFYPSLVDAQNDTAVITNPSAYVNQINYVQTLGIRLTNASTGCFVISTMDIRVEEAPQLAVPSNPFSVCDSNLDGMASFDLSIIAQSLQTSILYTLTFHLTLTDAQTGANPLPSPFFNTVPSLQTIYVRALDIVAGCDSIVPIVLEVNPSPFAIGPQSYLGCDNYSNPYDGIAAVNLTMFQSSILGGQNPASVQVQYFSTMLDAQSGTNAISLASAQNYVTSSTTIWVRVGNNSGCYALTTIDIDINSTPILTTPSPLSVCDADTNPNDQFVAFDLTVKNNEITQGAAGYSVTYYPSLANAQAGTNPITNPTSFVNSLAAIQTIGVRVTSPSGCESITTLDIRVLPIPAPNTNPPALVPKCDETNGQMLANFDLTVNAAYIINGDPSLTLHYFRDFADAQFNSNEIVTPTNALIGGNVWIRVENNRVDFQGNSCYVLVEQPLTIYPMPNPIIVTANNLNTVYIDGSNTVVQPLLLDSSITGNFSYEWYEIGNPSIIVGTGSTYLVDTPSLNNMSRNYSVHVTNLSTGCDMTSSSFIVLQSNGVPPPAGFISQSLPAGSTLADIVVNGVNVQWYAAASNKTGLVINSVPLPLNTVLMDGVTYYASQTVGGIESLERLPVTIHLTLGVDDNEILPVQFAPNPVKNSLTLQSTKNLKSVVIYTMLGQKVFEQCFDAADLTLDLSNLTSGNYILKAENETGQKTIRIIKE